MSKQSNHTAAPWVTRNGSPAQLVVETQDGMWIASVGQSVEAAEQAANARLIAAAPDLLEALEELVEFAAREMGLEPVECISGQIGRARAAIAKAKAKGE